MNLKRFATGIATILVLTSVVGLAACQRKHADAVKAVKTEKVVAAPAVPVGPVSLQSLDARVTEIEKRMTRARAQYAKDRAAVVRALPLQ